jgi:hypothetical protein
MNETTKIFKKDLDLDVSEFTYVQPLDLLHDTVKGEVIGYVNCYTCGNWSKDVHELKNNANNNHPTTIFVGNSCADYFELPDNASALTLANHKRILAEKERAEWKEAIREFGINEPEIAQMGEFLSTINDYYMTRFRKIKYNYGAEFVEGLRKLTLETWEEEVNNIIRDTRLANRVQLENGLQEITAKVEKVYTAETQWGYQRRLILDVNANTLFVNITKALEEVNEGDTITIELEVSMFETAKYGEEIEVSETNPNGHSFTGMGKAGRRKLINHIKA